MKGETYVYRNGKIVNKQFAGPRHHARDPRVHVISDTCEFKSMADGNVYTSKARYRADLRARGLEEVGNDQSWRKAQRPAFDHGNVAADIKRSIEELRSR